MTDEAERHGLLDTNIMILRSRIAPDFAGLGQLLTVIPVTRPEVPNERQAAR